MDPITLITTFSTRFLGIFIEAVSFLLLGTLISGLLEAFVTHDDIVRIMPRRTILAVLAGSFLGFIFPVLWLVPSLHAVVAVHMRREDRRHREIVEAIERHGPPPGWR